MTISLIVISISRLTPALFRYFFLVLLALILLGLFNGLVFLPVLLVIVGPPAQVVAVIAALRRISFGPNTSSIECSSCLGCSST